MIIFGVDSLASKGMGTLAVIFIPLKEVEVKCHYKDGHIDHIHFIWPWLETHDKCHLTINDINIAI